MLRNLTEPKYKQPQWLLYLMVISGVALLVMNRSRIYLEFWIVVGGILKLQPTTIWGYLIQLGVDAFLPLFLMINAVFELRSRSREKISSINHGPGPHGGD
jgi:hypothetical protein